MWSLIKKLIVCLTVLTAVSLCDQEAFGSNNNNNVFEDYESQQKEQLVRASSDGTEVGFGSPSTRGGLANPLLDMILDKASNHTRPIDLMLVCKTWLNVIKELKCTNTNPSKEKSNPLRKLGAKIVEKLTSRRDAAPLQEISFSTINPRLRKYMCNWWGGMQNWCLRYRDPESGEISRFPFLDILSNMKNTNGTFDLKRCRVTTKANVVRSVAEKVQITLSVRKFLEKGGDNQNKVVVLIAPLKSLKLKVNDLDTHLADLIHENSPVKGPIRLFYRWGNDENLSWIDSSGETPETINSANLYEMYWPKFSDVRHIDYPHCQMRVETPFGSTRGLTQTERLRGMEAKAALTWLVGFSIEQNEGLGEQEIDRKLREQIADLIATLDARLPLQNY